MTSKSKQLDPTCPAFHGAGFPHPSSHPSIPRSVCKADTIRQKRKLLSSVCACLRRLGLLPASRHGRSSTPEEQRASEAGQRSSPELVLRDFEPSSTTSPTQTYSTLPVRSGFCMQTFLYGELQNLRSSETDQSCRKYFVGMNFKI